MLRSATLCTATLAACSPVFQSAEGYAFRVVSAEVAVAQGAQEARQIPVPEEEVAAAIRARLDDVLGGSGPAVHARLEVVSYSFPGISGMAVPLLSGRVTPLDETGRPVAAPIGLTVRSGGSGIFGAYDAMGVAASSVHLAEMAQNFVDGAHAAMTAGRPVTETVN